MFISKKESQLNSIYQRIKNILIGTLLWIFVLIPFLFVPVLLPLTLCRLLINFVARIFRPDLIPCTNQVENVFAAKIANPKNQQNTNLLMILKLGGKLDCDKFRKHFYECFLSTDELKREYQNFYCTFVEWMGYSFKKHVGSIDLKDRIRVYEDVTNLESFVAKKLTLSDFGGENDPRWDISIIHTGNKFGDDEAEENSGIGTVLVFRIDHGLADGYSLINVLDKLLGSTAPYIVKPEEFGKLNKVLSTLVLPKTFLDTAFSFIWDKRIPHLSKTSSTDGGRSKKLVSFTTLDLESLKMVRRSTKAHFNVVAGMLQIGAMRRYLLETGKIKCEEELPEYSYISAPSPVPNHPAMIEDSDIKMLNQMGLQFWKVPNHASKMNSIDRILKAEEDFLKGSETQLEKLFHEFLTPLSSPLPTKLLILIIHALGPLGLKTLSHGLSPLMVSNREDRLFGHPVSNVYFMTSIRSLISSIKLYVLPVAYNSQLDICVHSESEAFGTQDDLDRFTKVLLKEELEEMVAACEEGEFKISLIFQEEVV